MHPKLALGDLSFDNNIIQGPLAGYSNAPFRLLTWQWGRPAFSCTEMISSKALVNQPRFSHQRYLKKDPKEGPVCFQLSGNDPTELALAANIVTDCGADLIDLNCGCPVNKIRRKGLGSSLLGKPADLYHLITALKKNTHVPVSIKIRVQSEQETFNAEIAKVVMEAGADFLVVHGRHWTEHYETSCRYDEIKFFVEAVNIPVIGNGDIACVTSLQKMYETGCAGVMIARAGVGQPWLTQKLLTELAGDVFVLPSTAQIGALFIEHVEGLVQLCGSEKYAVIQARKLAKYYARGLKNRTDFVDNINNISLLQDLVTVCSDYFAPRVVF